jgi:hypothetical protein
MNDPLIQQPSQWPRECTKGARLRPTGATSIRWPLNEMTSGDR